MYYSKADKFVSIMVIFLLLFGTTFRVPFLQFSTLAGSSDFYNLVSIIVDENTYSELGDEIKRYGKDIQGVLENTKAVILPISSDTEAFNISSMNESLFFDGLKGLREDVNFESKLVGTVLVGNFNLPVVYKNGDSEKTIVPFTDFIDKSYIYNNTDGKYEYNKENKDGLKVDIWHGVISPNLGSKESNINGLKDYFNKNHDFYEGTGNFKLSEGILNGSDNDGIPEDYDPYVFYFDSFRENKSLSYESYKAYNAYLKNKEDINYSRFNKDLADKIKAEIEINPNEKILDFIEEGGIDSTMFEDSLNLDNVPDIQTRHVILKSFKKYVEIFSKGTIGKFRADVHNAGRYNKEGSVVNMDMVSYLVTVLDSINDRVLLESTNDLENVIDDLVINGLSRKIIIPTKISENGYSNNVYSCNEVTYENYLYGKKASSITNANECTIYRGSLINSGSLVESNRGLNTSLVSGDIDKCSLAQTNGYWGKNSPLNIDMGSASDGVVALNASDKNGAILPIFDIAGSFSDTNLSNVPSPLNCLDNNLLLAEKVGYDDYSEGCNIIYRIPTYGSARGWSCNTDSNNGTVSGSSGYLYGYNFGNSNKTYSEDLNYLSLITDNIETCDIKNVYLNGSLEKTIGGVVMGDCYSFTGSTLGGSCNICNSYNNLGTYNNYNTTNYYFNTISSHITHKSPTAEELKEEIKAAITPNLAIDRDRYIDFIDSKGDYAKINYPFLYRVGIEGGDDFSLEDAADSLDEYLDSKSDQINELISTSDPSTLTGDNLEIYNTLNTGDYPSHDFDLVSYLKDKGDQTIEIDGESKDISYYDSLVFAIYWNNLSSVSAKYAFVYENYLSDQLSNDSKYFLPKNKKEYEIAYLGSHGNSSNMYIKSDPEGKNDNPFSNILKENQILNNSLFSSNIGDESNNDNIDGSLFKCSPPDGVPITEWFPSVICWLNEMLPPTVGISEGQCGSDVLLLSEEERDELDSCNGDVDKNGINDCLEGKLIGGSLELKASGNKFYYNKYIDLTSTIFDSNGLQVRIANNTDIKFEIIKLDFYNDQEGVQTIFDINNESLSDENLINDYINFDSKNVNSMFGESKYGFSVKNKDVDITLRSVIKIKEKSLNLDSDNNGVNEYVDGEGGIFLESEELLLKVRGDVIQNSSNILLYNSESELEKKSGDTIVASDQTNVYLLDSLNTSLNNIDDSLMNDSSSSEKLIFSLSNFSNVEGQINLEYPLELKVNRGSNEVIDSLVINSLNSPRGFLSLSKSGEYSIEVTDSNGLSVIKNFTVLPDVANNLDVSLSSTVLEKGGNITTNTFSILDKYGNPAVGNIYTTDIEINGSSVFFDGDYENNKSISLDTYEGYSLFNLKSRDQKGVNSISFKLKDEDGNILYNETKLIKVIDEIHVSFQNTSGRNYVGGDTYSYVLNVRGSDGTIIDDFNSRVYISTDNLYLDTNQSYFDLDNGVANIDITTKNIAVENLTLDFQIVGISGIIEKNLTIYPGDPMKVNLLLEKDSIEASSSDSSLLRVELKDRYGNVVFTDNETKVFLTIPEIYSSIITSSTLLKTVEKGKTSYSINGTNIPGIAHFKVTTTPGLEQNSFIISDENGDITINGVGKNSGSIETFYLWNKDKIKNRKYNSIYTTLLGSSYGDITVEDYLAGSLLFEKDNRSLVVTSLLNKGININKVFNINRKGAVNTISGSDISQDINATVGLLNNKLYLNLYNSALNIYIGKLLYNFDDNVSLDVCNSNILECNSSLESTSIIFKADSNDYTGSVEDDILTIRNRFGESLLDISNSGSIIRNGNVSLELSENNNSEYLLVNLFNGDQKVGVLSFNLFNFSSNLSRDNDNFVSKLNHTSDFYKNNILFLLNTSSYSLNKTESGNIISYNDPFSSSNNLDNFNNELLYGYENFPNEAGLGWKGENKTLLSFSSGKNVGESTKDYISFSLINLGDPVVSLKKIKEKLPKTTTDRKFDSTIGKIVSVDKDIVGYDVFDYDADNKDDLLIIKNNNSLKLLENKDVSETFLDKGNIARIIDLGERELIKTGDFTGDNYDDIFFVNDKGKPFLLNNYKKDFQRISLGEYFNIDGRIIRVEKYDMDDDSKDDIVVLDSNGDINIFYGGGIFDAPSFTKSYVGGGYGITLDGSIRTDNSFIYFDGLHQNNNTTSMALDSDEMTINNLMYVESPYFKDELDISEEVYNSSQSRTFVKSEYSELEGVRIEKVFTDENGGIVKDGDKVLVKIKVENISGSNLDNVIFFDKIDDFFNFDILDVKNDMDLEINPKFGNYDYGFRGFSLLAGGILNIEYDLTVLPLEYGFIKVGLFEKEELGDDNYGDIIIKSNNQNCSETVEIYRSQNSRTYLNGLKEPVCDLDKNKLPDEIEKNSFDEDGNGIPDYIDELTDPANIDLFKEYSEEQLGELNIDTDSDGIPDSEDPGYGNILNDLGNITESTDKYLNDVDEVMEQISCGFGGGSCFATPMNWAPLAPGNDPTFNGSLLGDGLKVDEGLPIISGLTGINIPTPAGCYQVPAIWPISPFEFVGTCSTTLGAGGYMGVDSPSNFFRLFVTPTITGSIGTAVCFGGPASVVGNSIPEGLSPFIPGGNCIVTAKPLSKCSLDGSDGDIASTGFADLNSGGSDGSGFGIFNGNCSQAKPANSELSKDFASEYVRLRDSGEKIDTNDFKKSIDHGIYNDPLFSMNGGDGSIGIQLSTDTGLESYADIETIEKSRVYGFPSFLMSWVDRQIEEIINKLTDFPTIFIILPDFSGVFDFGNEPAPDMENFQNLNTVNSGIKEAYDFLSNIPLVNLEQERININLPWITKKSLEKKLVIWNKTLDQREDEYKRAENEWLNAGFDNNIDIGIEPLISGLKANIAVLEEYKKLPEKINKLITVKERYLEQILCNIEVISELTGGRISKNGDRFKAWVELYILIKAMLKSWQALVDIFIDFDAECSECKNERGDAQDYTWSLIDAIMPQIPLITFPRWPDIELDLHNIRAGMDILLPEFDVNIRPLVLPNLPNLYLPDTPSVNINLPSIPVLPSIEIPELPDLPSLPSVELPDLPPPPKLPKMIGGITAMVDILKIVTKMMCLVKQLPFVPEWRAGDLIAFLTERNGYLGIDFINMTMPQFSVQSLDKIKVSTYVNLEFETDFVVEMAKSITEPINSVGNNFQNVFNLNANDLDFRGVLPTDIDVDISIDGGVANDLESLNIIQIFSLSFLKFYDEMYSNKDAMLSNREFISEILSGLESDTITKSNNKNIKGIAKLWNDVANLKYEKEDRHIVKLLKNNKNKYSTIRDIINTEIVKNNKLKEQIELLNNDNFVQKVSFDDTSSDIDLYNSKLKVFNNAFIDSAKNLVNVKVDNSLKIEGEKLLSRVKTPLERYNKDKELTFQNNVSSELGDTSLNQCQQQAQSDYKYIYKGIYIVENDTSYRLFDYLEEVNGDEEMKLIDFDGDNDEDIIYLSNGSLYLKENLVNSDSKVYTSEDPEIIDINDNKFLNGSIFYESINNISESLLDNGTINISFSSSDNGVKNYKLEFYNRVDKFRNIGNLGYRPEYIKNTIIDGFVGIDDNTVISESGIRSNLSYINEIGSLNDLNLKTNELRNIKDDIDNNISVSLTIGSRLFTGDNSISITYLLDEEENTIDIPHHSNIEFGNNILITEVSGDIYIKSNNIIELSGNDIREYIDKPLFVDSEFWYSGLNTSVNEQNYIVLRHYDGTDRVMHFGETERLILLDLGDKGNKYNIRASVLNDYYYAKINGFKDNKYGTSSRQILISPQIEADENAPELSLNSIRIPVYQEKTIDITYDIFEDFGGVSNIKDVIVDLEIDTDSDLNGDLLDDISSNVVIIKNEESIKIKFNAFDTIFRKLIAITLTDGNDNKSISKVILDVYAPVPNIDLIEGDIISGELDEDLSGEPINIYRFRGGTISKLSNNLGGFITDTSTGSFDFNVSNDLTNGLTLKEGISTLAFINEETGLISEINNLIVDVDVITTPTIGYPNIVIKKDSNNIYEEHIEIEGSSKVNVVTDFEGYNDSGVYVNFINKVDYNYYITPEGLEINPGALTIYDINDSSKESLVTIFNDGRFKINDDNFDLEYNTYGDYVSFKLLNNNEDVANILLLVNGEYIMQ